jgi:hypothetical protein
VLPWLLLLLLLLLCSVVLMQQCNTTCQVLQQNLLCHWLLQTAAGVK